MRYANWKTGVWHVVWDLDESGETRETQKLNCFLKSDGQGDGNWPLAVFTFEEMEVMLADIGTLETHFPGEYSPDGQLPQRHELLHWMRNWVQDVLKEYPKVDTSH